MAICQILDVLALIKTLGIYGRVKNSHCMMEVFLYKEARLFKDNKIVCLAQNKEELYECELNIIYYM